MCAWEEEDYEKINKELLKKAGINNAKPQQEEKSWKVQERFERVPSSDESPKRKPIVRDRIEFRRTRDHDSRDFKKD